MAGGSWIYDPRTRIWKTRGVCSYTWMLRRRRSIVVGDLSNQTPESLKLFHGKSLHRSITRLRRTFSCFQEHETENFHFLLRVHGRTSMFSPTFLFGMSRPQAIVTFPFIFFSFTNLHQHFFLIPLLAQMHTLALRWKKDLSPQFEPSSDHSLE